MPDRLPDQQNRLTELETSLAYQQRLCEQLNQVVCEHTQQILGLQRTIAELGNRLKEMHQQRKEPPLDPALEKPPHY